MFFRRSISPLKQQNILKAVLLAVIICILVFRRPFASLLEPSVPEFNQSSLSRVLYSANGLIAFETPDSDGAETYMDQLVKNAQAKWDSTLERQSQTLKMAVREYQRRHHGRLPPRGFEKWWKFVKDNDVLLVDEFNQIFKDLEPFYAIQPDRLREIVDEVDLNDGSRKFAFEFAKNGTFLKTAEYQTSGRMMDLVDLMESFSGYFQGLSKGFKMVINVGDGPEVRVTWRERAKLAELTRSGKFINAQEHKKLSTDLSSSEGCPADATAQNLTKGHQTLIYDHMKAMEVCSNPELIGLHGSLLAQQQQKFVSIRPVFSFSRSSLCSDIRVTPLSQYRSVYGGTVYDWEDPRRIDKVFWRGSTTGTYHGKDSSWRGTQRIRLCNITNLATETKKLANGQEIDLKEVNPRWFDAKFAGQPVQCDPEVCEELKGIFEFSELATENTAYRYKYVIDVDGNGWSGRFHRLLSSNRVTIKSTVYPEWYGERIQPWYHYIPSKVDYSDLHDIAYFLRTHDAVAKQIARNAMQWAKTHWRREDMAAYMFRLLLEWSRLYNREICAPWMQSDECDRHDFDLAFLK